LQPIQIHGLFEYDVPEACKNEVPATVEFQEGLSKEHRNPKQEGMIQ